MPFVQKMLGPDYSANLIMTVAGILETNCFEICLMSQNRELGGLFLLSLILSHDCIPNTKHFVNDDFQMTFQTTGGKSFVIRFCCWILLANKHLLLRSGKMFFQQENINTFSWSPEMKNFFGKLISLLNTCSSREERRNADNDIHADPQDHHWASSPFKTSQVFRLWLRAMQRCNRV